MKGKEKKKPSTLKEIFESGLTIEKQIRLLAQRYSRELDKKIAKRIEEMKVDDNSHYLVYQVLGIVGEEGELIDLYQNKGRFLYKYAGAFMEDAAFLCFKNKFSDAKKKKVKNMLGKKPEKFEIDCLIDKKAIEIKWRDATTDGDHITKEHTRVQVIKGYGYTPIRLMFYYPNREQAMKIQSTLKTLYAGVDGEYYSGDAAFEYVNKKTGNDLKEILTKIAKENIEEYMKTKE